MIIVKLKNYLKKHIVFTYGSRVLWPKPIDEDKFWREWCEKRERAYWEIIANIEKMR